MYFVKTAFGMIDHLKFKKQASITQSCIFLFKLPSYLKVQYF